MKLKSFHAATLFQFFVVMLLIHTYVLVAFSASNCNSIDFEQAPEFVTGPGPKGVLFVDLDGDARLDIAAAFQNTTAGFSVLRGIGGGQFASKIDIQMPSQGMTIETVFAFDLDSDGRKDIVISSALNNKISIFRNTSSGTGDISFEPRVDYLTGGNKSNSVTFGDFDGDSRVDIAVGTIDSISGISLFRNLSETPDGIVLAQRIDFPMIGGAVERITAGDFDTDGKVDIAVGAGPSRRYLTILRNTSTSIGSFAFSTSTTFDLGGRATGITAADLDGDGRADVAISGSSRASVFRNTSSGAGNIDFAPRLDVPTGLSSQDIVSADLDGDGKVDLATANQGGNSISVLRNVSPSGGSILFSSRTFDYGAGIGPYRLAVGDSNSDGKIDITTANINGGNVSVLFNTSSGPSDMSFRARIDHVTFANTGVSGITSGDFDGDGDADIAAVAGGSTGVARIVIHRNNGNGTFLTSIEIPTQQAYDALFSIDVDGNNLADLVVLSGTAFQVFQNTSNGNSISFSNVFIAVPGSPLRKGLHEDIDGDGIKELLLSGPAATFSSYGKGFIFRRNSGSSIGFSLAYTIENVAADGLMHVADFDGDLKKDILFSSGITDWLLVVNRNVGSAGQFLFDPYNIVENSQTLEGPVVLDLDQDGKIDIAALERFDANLYRNLSVPGNTVFAPKFVVPNALYPPRGTADISSDGREDVLVEQFKQSVSVFENGSTGAGNLAFAESKRFAINGNGNGSSNYTSFNINDFDNDGKPDLAVGFYSSTVGTVTVLLNRSCVVPNFAKFDFDGDSKTDIGIYRPNGSSGSEWWLQRSSDGSSFATQFGAPTDRVAAADYTGDGKTDVAFWRPSTGFWYVLRSEDQTFYAFPFGANGDVPVPSDYDADGKADVGVFRPTDNTWYIQRSSDNGTTIQQFGTAGDVPVNADYDGDSKADIAIYRPSAGQWWLSRSTAGNIAYQFGSPTDKTVVGDYTGDGKADVAFWRPSTGEWFILRSEDSSFFGFPFGTNGDTPVPGDYDGDGRNDAGVFRSSNSTWYINRTTAGTLIQQFGATGDVPLPSAFVR